MTRQGEAPTRAEATVTLRSGNRMPVLGLGTWQLTHETRETVEYALTLGYRMIDTSSDYGTQPAIGDALQRSRIDRGDVYIVAKVEETDEAYEATREYLDEMKLEYADLMLIHRPPDSGAGDALWDGLIRANREGLARDIGVSNYDADRIRALASHSGETPAVNQIEWTPFGHSLDTLRFSREQGIVIQAYSPLTRATRLDDERLTAIGRRHGKTAAQVLLRWNLQLGTVPLPKANRREHLEEDIDVFDFTLSEDEMNTLNALNEHASALGVLPYL